MQRDFALERRAQRIVWVAAIVGVIGTLVLYWPWATPSAWRISVGCGGVALIWIALITWIWKTSRIASAAHNHRFFICPACRYNLHGLPEAGVCPECGRPYTNDELHLTWKREMGMPHFDPEDELRMILDSYEENPRA